MQIPEIHERKTNQLIPYENNARINDDAVDAVAASIQEFGFNVPIVIDKHDVIIAGHTRLKAAKKLGLTTVPTIMLESLTSDKVRAYRLADNKTSELSTWNFEKLESELDALTEVLSMADFGFDMGEQDFAAVFTTHADDDATPEKRQKHETSHEQQPSLDASASYEVDISEFDASEFAHVCPRCGMRFN